MIRGFCRNRYPARVISSWQECHFSAKREPVCFSNGKTPHKISSAFAFALQAVATRRSKLACRPDKSLQHEGGSDKTDRGIKTD